MIQLKKIRVLLAFILGMLVVMGCPGGDEGAPVIDVNLITISPADSAGFVAVSGAPGSITDDTPPITYVITNLNTWDYTHGTVEPDGSFYAGVFGSEGDPLYIYAEDPHGNGDEVFIGDVPPPGDTPIVNTISPMYGMPGTQAAIGGENFGGNRNQISILVTGQDWQLEVPAYRVYPSRISFHIPVSAPFGHLDVAVIKKDVGESGPVQFEVVTLPALLNHLIQDTEGACDRGDTANPGMEDSINAKLENIGDSLSSDAGHSLEAKLENLIAFIGKKSDQEMIALGFSDILLPTLEAAFLDVRDDLDREAPLVEPDFVSISPAYLVESLGHSHSFLSGAHASVCDAGGNQIILAYLRNETSEAVSESFRINRDGSFQARIRADSGDLVSLAATDDYGNMALIPLGAVPEGGPNPEAPQVDTTPIVAHVAETSSGEEPFIHVLVLPGSFSGTSLPFRIEIRNESTGFTHTETVFSLDQGIFAEIPGVIAHTYSCTAVNVLNLQDGAPVEPERKPFVRMVQQKVAGLFAGPGSLLVRNADGSLSLRAPSPATKRTLGTWAQNLAEQMRSYKKFSHKGTIPTPQGNVPVNIRVGANGQSGDSTSNGNGGPGQSATPTDNRPGALVVGVGGNGGNGTSTGNGCGGNGGHGTATANGAGGMAVGAGGTGGNGTSNPGPPPSGPGGTGGHGGSSNSTTTGSNGTSISHAGNGGHGGTLPTPPGTPPGTPPPSSGTQNVSNARPQATPKPPPRPPGQPAGSQRSGQGGNGGTANSTASGDDSTGIANGGGGGNGAHGRAGTANSDGAGAGNGGDANISANGQGLALAGNGGNGGNGQPQNSNGGAAGSQGSATASPIGAGSVNAAGNGADGNAGTSFQGGNPR